MSKPSPLFSPEKIKGPYSLLAAFLLIVEASLGYWLINSTDRTEKIIAGAMITVIFLVFLYISWKIVQVTFSAKVLQSEGVGELKPASRSITEAEAEDRQAEVMISHDRSFMIERPAGEWEIEEMRASAWAGKSLGISDKQLLEKLVGKDEAGDRVMVISHPKEFFLIPTPGKTLIDGAAIPTALQVPAFFRLSILPMERRQAPFYLERPMVHNFNVFLMSILSQGVLTLVDHQTVSEKNGSSREIAIMRQNLENVMINGENHRKASIYISMIGIGGKIKDHVMMLQYFTTSGEDPNMENRLKELQNIINSFKPVMPADREKVRQDYEQQMDEKFASFIKSYGVNLFMNEFGIALARLKNSDLEKIQDRQKVIETLKPFRDFAAVINLKDDSLSTLLDAVDEAEKGNAGPLKKILPPMMKNIENYQQQ